MLLDLDLVREQLRVRQELLKTNRKLLLEIDEQSHHRGENCLALLIQNGSIRRNTDGSLRINALKPFPRTAKPPRPLSVPPTAKRPPAPPSDYPKLIEANRRRTWDMSTQWYRQYRDLLFYVERNNRAQIALAAAKLSALELAIPVPDVRVWSGEEAQAANKVGWACSTQHEVNVTILNQGCKQIALTAAHEVKHVNNTFTFRI